MTKPPIPPAVVEALKRLVYAVDGHIRFGTEDTGIEQIRAHAHARNILVRYDVEAFLSQGRSEPLASDLQKLLAELPDEGVVVATRVHFEERRKWRTHGPGWAESCEIPGWEQSKYEAMRLALSAALATGSVVICSPELRELLDCAVADLGAYNRANEEKTNDN